MSKVIYPVQRYQNLFIINAAIDSSTTAPKVIRMLVDTGASNTLISRRILTTAGYDPEISTRAMTLIAAGGSLRAPVVHLNWFNCLGNQVENFPVLAWNLPGGINTSGLLGMDFLNRIKAVIDVSNGTITVETPE
jgi:clan AA aspartic protease (TIGR02281 family)